MLNNFIHKRTTDTIHLIRTREMITRWDPLRSTPLNQLQYRFVLKFHCVVDVVVVDAVVSHHFWYHLHSP